MDRKELVKSILKYNHVLGQRIDWLEKMREIVKLEKKEEVKSTNKKKIAIVYDVDGWAFHNIAKEIQKNLSGKYEIDIFAKSVFNHNVVRLMFLTKKYDLIHVLWRGMFSELDGEYLTSYIRSLGISKEEFIKRYIMPSNITTSVYDHSFLNEEAIGITKAFIKYTKAYTVSSDKLKEIYNNLEIEKKPSMEITDGVDLNKFKPKNLERFKDKNKKIIYIGWVGNSKFTDSEQDEDLKGVRKIILPAIEELQKEGYPIQKRFADRDEGYIPHDKMPDYYNSIDLYVCASKVEGTPNPILESMACGIPVISTDVGIVKEALGEKQQKYIMEERTKQELKKKIKEFLDNPQDWNQLSEENLTQIKNWSWENKCKQFEEFFESNLKNNMK